MICYIILHYNNVDETVKCVESLKQTVSKDSKIVIVDNGSVNGSGNKLKKIYGLLPQCEIIFLPQNVGFSKGNNIGYRFVRDKYSPDYVVIANNDVVFYQDDFESKIERIYKRTRFDVLGPDIYIPRHKDHQNPLFKTGITIAGVKKELEKYRFYNNNPKKFINRLKLHAFKNMLCSRFQCINMLYCLIRGKDSLNYRREYDGVGLQGSCLIFSKTFIEKEIKAFEPEPFLYEEEVFLFFRCKKKGYKMVYSPSIGIRHEEGASFNYGKTDLKDKVKFMLACHIKAREELLLYLKDQFNN